MSKVIHAPGRFLRTTACGLEWSVDRQLKWEWRGEKRPPQTKHNLSLVTCKHCKTTKAYKKVQEYHNILTGK